MRGDRANPALPSKDTGLDDLGLEVGEVVRFRRRASERWKDGVVTRRERDGSVGLRDDRGAARALPVEAILVRCVGRRGGPGWEPLAERAQRSRSGRQLTFGLG